MDDPRDQEAAAWFQRAQEDLVAARRLLGDEPLTGIAAYHCQQAAEKALKAYLVLKDTPFPKTHDLDVLVRMCAHSDPQFATLQSNIGARPCD